MRRWMVVAVGLALLSAGWRAEAGVSVGILPESDPKVDVILSPLGSVPEIVEPGDTFRIELARPPAYPNFYPVLMPSFGRAKVPVPLRVEAVVADVPSAIWPDRIVTAVEVRVPGFEPGRFVEDLYDIAVPGSGFTDVQRRAVKVVQEIPDHPRFVVIADPSVGDPRPIQEGADDAANDGDTDSLADKTVKTIGLHEDPAWGAFQKVIEEVNLASPDFVLVAGDLTFGVYPRAANHEYEEAWELIDTMRVPTFLTPGNHDLYHFDYDHLDRPHTTDGKELWQLYFGPVRWSKDVGDDLHLMSIDTYDWPHTEREVFRLEDEGSTRSGGYVSDEQLAWIADDLRSWRAEHPDGEIVTFAHHDPSWLQRRHPWPGLNRLELRDLMAETRVGAHFAGHTHDDRVARYHEGHVVETNGNNSFPRRELHYVRRDGTLDGSWTQGDLAAVVREPAHGPVFVNTTTAASGLKGPDWGLGSYWGWRLGTLRDVDEGYDPADFGYPATAEFLESHAERPENYNPDHAPLGVFSYPSYFIDVDVRARDVRIASRLLADLEVVVPLSLEAGPGKRIEVTGGTLLRHRSAGGTTDVWIGLTVPAGGESVVEVRVRST